MNNNIAPNIAAYADKILARVRVLENPYFSALKSGEMSIEKFRQTQEQFCFAVAFFSCPMSVLVGRIPDVKDRLDILHNLLEEHGELNEDKSHPVTFQNFLKSIGGKIEDLKKITLSPVVRAFNNALHATCTFDEIAITSMGMIEWTFAGISALIANVVVEREWVVVGETLYHYKLHADIDIRHSEEFFAVVEKYWDNEEKQYLIKQGLELGVYLFDRLYRDLYRLF